jgi:diguanylate cyclase (GGDEF)-like protein
MPQTISLPGENKSPLQVIALDSRKSEQVVSDKQYLKILQMSDLLSRTLKLEEMLKIFSNEVAALIPHASYRYSSDHLEKPIRFGNIGQHSLNYHLTIQQMDLGELTLYRKTPFSSNEVCQFEDLLCSLVHPLKNALLYHVAVESAYKDPLTNINNRAAMDKMLPREIRLAKRHDHRLALMIMDLDGFKSVNDNLGHDVGDRLLVLVAQSIQDVLRDTDMLYRYGGDEFVAALPYTDAQGAIDVANRILNVIRNIEHSDFAENIQIGLSVGLSMLHAGDDFDRLFKRVDQALYRAKKGGKNRVVIS